MEANTRHRGARRAGFALVAALGFGLALAAIAAGVSRDGRGVAAAAAGAVGAAQARAAAEAGLWRAAVALSTAVARPSADGPALDGAAERWTFEGAAVEIAVRAERGKADLNRAGSGVLSAAARAAGHPDPAGFAARVVARRAEHAAAGVPWRLDAAPFESASEGAALAEAGVRRARGALLTVHGAAAPDAAAAPAALARALGVEPSARPSPPRRGDVVEIVAVAETPEGARAAVAALVALGEGGVPRILSWRDAPTLR